MTSEYDQLTRRSIAEDSVIARHLVIGVVWIARLVASFFSVPAVLLLLIDLGLVIGHIWATMPIRRQLATRFGFAPSGTRLLLLGQVVAVLLLIRDSWMWLGRP